MRKVGTVALAAALLGVAIGGLSDAAPRSRFVRLPGRGANPGFLPASQAAASTVVVTIGLEDAPLSTRRKEADGAFDASAEAAARQDVAAAQQPVADAVVRLGGEVLFQLHETVNAVVVRVPSERVAQLGALPGVTSVRQSRRLERDNTVVNAYTGASTAWQALGVTGRGTKIAVIDDGVDYHHATFGGSGRAADFANDDRVSLGGGFPSAKVAGGYDLVGDAYDAASTDPALRVPQPDPDPLACGTHGTHVAGSAAGAGVTTAGTTYAGPYDAASVAGLAIGPGAAPEATVYAYKVFGCDGATDDAIVAAAIDRAVADGVDVISLSLGAPFGTNDSVDAQAIAQAVAAGVTVVASAGNDGPNAYLVASPGTADGAISVGALDASLAEFPAATIGVSPAASAIVANDAAFSSVSGTVRIAGAAGAAPAATIGLGCSPSEFAAVRLGDIVVVKRGTCTRADKARLAAAAGAAAVVLVNTQAGLPPFEGAIAGVTVPLLGTLSSAGPALLAAQGTVVTVTRVAPIPNPGYGQMATFSAGGPRNGDSATKPDLAAPGVSVLSAAAGSGTGGQRESGTSMAVPHVAGVAALLHQRRPDWTPAQVKAALMNTADATVARIRNVNLRVAGSGVLDAVRALSTEAVATTADGTGALSYGYRPSRAGLSVTRTFTLENRGAAPLTYDLDHAFNGGVGADRGTTVTIDPATVVVPAGASVEVAVTLSLPASAVAKLPDASQPSGQVVVVRGAVTATPREAGAVPLRVPFSLVPRGLSNLTVDPAAPLVSDGVRATGVLPLANSGVHRGTADVYAWLLADGAERDTPSSVADLRSLGVQTYPGALLGSTVPDDQAIVFAVNVEDRWSSASTIEIDLPIDTNGDGAWDFVLVGADYGAVMNGSDNGQFAAFTFDRRGVVVDVYIADAPMNGSTVLLPTLASDLGITPTSPPFTVQAQSVDRLTRVIDVLPGRGRWQPYRPAVSNADLLDLTAASTADLPVWVSLADQADQQVLGWLVVTLDDRNGDGQADRVPLAGLLP